MQEQSRKGDKPGVHHVKLRIKVLFLCQALWAFSMEEKKKKCWEHLTVCCQRRLAHLMISARASVLHSWPGQMEIKTADPILLFHPLTRLHLSQAGWR